MSIIRTRCPKCQVALKIAVDDAAEPAEVTCLDCGATFVPRARPRPRPLDDDDEPLDSLLEKRARAQQRRTTMTVCGIAGVMLLVGGTIAGILVLGKKKDQPEIAKAEPKQSAEPVPRNKAEIAKPKSSEVELPVAPSETDAPPVAPKGSSPNEVAPVVEPSPPPVKPKGDGSVDDVFTRAASFRPAGRLARLPPLPPKSDRPMLALNAGGHNTAIKLAFLTPKGDRAITISVDQTVRIWDVASGETLHFIPLPTGSAWDDKNIVAALSPDGKRLAVGRNSTEKRVNQCPLFIISVESGQLEKAPLVAAKIINCCDFSPDGKLVAVGCEDGSLNVVSIAGRVTFTAKLRNSVREIHFHPQQPAIATLSKEGSVRTWSLTGPATVDFPPGAIKAQTIAWSSDGTMLARGGVKGEIEIHSASGASIKVIPVGVEKEPGAGMASKPIQLDALHFLPGDKEILYAGHTIVPSVGIVNIDSGDVRVDFLEHTDRVFGLGFAREANLAISAGGLNNEAFIWNRDDGKVVRKLAGEGNPVCRVAWARDGRSIAWGQNDKLFGNPFEFTFRLDEFGLGESPQPDAYLQEIKDDGQISIKMRNTREFVVRENGKVRYGVSARQSTEPLHSVTLIPGKGILTGSARKLLLIDTLSGAKIMDYTVDEGIISAAAPSPDGKYFVTASTDQTMKIWAVNRPEPLLSIFVAGTEWIAWTPEGFYSCSANGERLITWQVNEGAGKLPGVFPASRFRASLYQPALIKYLVPAGDLQLALAMVSTFERQELGATNLAEVMPPAVRITAPAESAVSVDDEKLTVKASAEGTEKRPVLSMRLIVDGRPYQGQAGVKRFENPVVKAEAVWEVSLTPGPHTIVAIAESAVSKGVSPPLKALRSGEVPTPNLYVLAVGISAYPRPNTLNFAASDAMMLTKALQANCRGVFGEVDVLLVTDREATRDGILKGLDWLKSKMTPKDVGVFFFSGHGYRDPKRNFYLVPVNVSPSDLAGSCLSGNVFRRRLENMPGRLISILDACHSGAAASFQSNGSADNLVRDLVADECGVMVMCSSLGREYSIESSKERAGYYTLALTEGLAGKADANGDGIVTFDELGLYSARRVSKLSSGLQHPVASRPPSIKPFAMTKRGR